MSSRKPKVADQEQKNEDCTSPRAERPKNWLPIHLFYSCTSFIANNVSSSTWLLILNCLPVSRLYLPCPPRPFSQASQMIESVALADVADLEPGAAACLAANPARRTREGEMSSSWKMICLQVKLPWPSLRSSEAPQMSHINYCRRQSYQQVQHAEMISVRGTHWSQGANHWPWSPLARSKFWVPVNQRSHFHC